MANGAVSDELLQSAIRAVNRQIAEDFAPYWGFGAHVRLEGKTGRKRADVDPADMRGDAILYLRKNTDLSDAEGYHDRHYLGIPYGFVFLDLSAALGEDWSVTFFARSAGVDRRSRGEPPGARPASGRAATVGVSLVRAVRRGAGRDVQEYCAAINVVVSLFSVKGWSEGAIVSRITGC